MCVSLAGIWGGGLGQLAYLLGADAHFRLRLIGVIEFVASQAAGCDSGDRGNFDTGVIGLVETEGAIAVCCACLLLIGQFAGYCL